MTSKEADVIDNINLTPFWATLLFIIAVITGHLYRKNWKNEGAKWKLWLYGSISGVLLLIIAFVPIS